MELIPRKFLDNFNPTRGYGGRIFGVMDRLRRGIPWNEAGTDSWGNGSAMRIAPIGFFFYEHHVKLREAAIQSSMITHKHPKGIAGGVAQATAVGIATRKGLNGEAVDVKGFIDLLIGDAGEIDQDMVHQLETIKGIEGGDLETTIDAISSRFYCDVSAIGAVPPDKLGASRWLGSLRYDDNLIPGPSFSPLKNQVSNSIK